MSLGASLQFTFGDRLLIRACAGFVALLATATALFAQASDFREKVFPTPSAARVDTAFTSNDEVFRRGQTISPEQSAIASTSHPENALIEKTPIRRTGSASAPTSTHSSGMNAVWVIVFVLIAAAGGVSVWARRHPSIRARGLPDSVFQILGRQQIGPGQSVLLARLGDRVVLLSMSADGLRTLADVNDPVEATRLTAECLASQSRGTKPNLSQRGDTTGSSRIAPFQVVGTRQEQLGAADLSASQAASDVSRESGLPTDRLTRAGVRR